MHTITRVAAVAVFTFAGAVSPLAAQALSIFTLSPNPVEGGKVVRGTVGLTSPAPAAGATVQLNIVEAVIALVPGTGSPARVPAEIVIASGQTFGSATIYTSTVAKPTTLQIEATYAGVTRTGSLEIQPPPLAISSVTLNPASVIVGGGATGTITLSGPAPADGLTVTLMSSHAEARVPESVVVAAGTTSGTFSVGTSPAPSSFTATIGAKYGTKFASGQLFVEVPVTVSALSISPTSVTAGESAVGTVSITPAAPAGGTSVAVSSSQTEVIPFSASIAQGANSGTFQITTLNPATDVTATLSARVGSTTGKSAQLTVKAVPATVSALTLNPSNVLPGATSTATLDLAAPAPTGGLVLNLCSSHADTTVPSTLSVPAGATRATFSVATKSTSPGGFNAAITAGCRTASSFNASLTVDALPPITVQSLAINPVAVVGSESAIGTVTLSRAAPAGGLTLTLTSSHPRASVPPAMPVAAGVTTAPFTINTSSGSSGTVTATIAASAPNTEAKTAQLSVLPVAIEVTSVSLNPTSVQGGAAVRGTVTLREGAPEGGAVIALRSSDAKATVPPSISIPAGYPSGQFSVQTSSVAQRMTATISTEGSAGAKSTTLTIDPLAVTAVSVNPTSVASGFTATGTVTIGAPAPPGGLVLSLTSSGLEASVPVTVMIPAGATSAPFTLKAVSSSATAVDVTLSAAATGTTASTTKVVITPPPPRLVSMKSDENNAMYVVFNSLIATFTGITLDREARIVSIRNTSGCRFTPFIALPFAVRGTPDGLESKAIIQGTYTQMGGPPTGKVPCSFDLVLEWRPVGSPAWQPQIETGPTFEVSGHESVTVTNTWDLLDWLDPTTDLAAALGDCLNGIRNDNGKVAIHLVATPLGADCAFRFMTPGNHMNDYTFNVLPEGVVLWSMVWKVETRGSGCCLGTSQNASCAPLPTPPMQYSFETQAGIDPTKTNGNHYAVFSNAEQIMTSQQIIIAYNTQKRWITAVMEIFGRLSCPAVSPQTTTYTTMGGALCDASCSVLGGLGLGLVGSGTLVGDGARLQYVDGWQGECRIVGGPFDGQCKSATSCPPGQDRFSDNGVWKCRASIVTNTDMPWIRVWLDSVTVVRPRGTKLPWE